MQRQSRTPKTKPGRCCTAGLADSSVEKRTKATTVLGLLPGDAKAEEAALKGLSDDKPDVRSAAAQALGDMKAKSAIRSAV